MDPEVAKLVAAETRLREVIRSIVKRRVAPGNCLSWRMMFEIEQEAISQLEEDPQLDFHYVNMMASPSAQRRPDGEEPSGLNGAYPLHTALWMIQEAFYHDRR